MVLIIVTSIFPSQSSNEVKQKYNEIQKKHSLPPFIIEKLSGLRWIKEGMKGMAIYKVTKNKIAEALNYIYRYELEYGEIEGYSNDIETLLEMEDLAGIISP